MKIISFILVFIFFIMPLSNPPEIVCYDFSEHRVPKELVIDHAKINSVPVAYALAIAEQESNFSCFSKSNHGAFGLMQIKPTTASEVGFNGQDNELLDCEINVRYGMIYLKKMLVKANGNFCKAATYYNVGPYSKSTNREYCHEVLIKHRKYKGAYV